MSVLLLLPNLITGLRFLLTFIGLYFLASGHSLWLFALCALLVYLSDLSDGVVARKLGAVSKLGEVLDIAADAFFVIASMAVLTLRLDLSPALIICIVAEFIVFGITSRYIKKEEGKVFAFDHLGKALGISFYLLPLFITILKELGALHAVFSYLTLTTLVLTLMVIAWRIYLTVPSWQRSQ